MTDREARAEILRIHRAWLSAELAGDPDAALRLCAIDIVWRPPGEPALVGIEVGRTLLAAGPARVESIEIGDVVIAIRGPEAFLEASFRTSMREPGTQSCRFLSGIHSWRLRHEPDGWRVAEVGWTVDAEGP